MLDDDDLRALGFMAEQRVVVEPQVHAALSSGTSAAPGPEAAAARLEALAAGGYVQREAIFAGQPVATWITARGLGAIERRLGAPRRPDLRAYRHDVGVAWLWLAARDGVFGELGELRSERELRAHDRRAQGQEAPAGEPAASRLGVRAGGIGPAGGERLHYPDFLLDTAGGRRVAIELELTGKGARRLDGIMRGYAFDARIDAVLYLVPDRALLARVTAAARRAGIADMVHVQRLAPGMPRGAPGPARTAVRVAGHPGERDGPAR